MQIISNSLLMFSIKDHKAGAFITPFFLPNEAMAIREFEHCCNDPEHQFQRYPQDYTLFHLGEFTPSTGELIPIQEKVLAHGADLKRSLNEYADLPTENVSTINQCNN